MHDDMGRAGFDVTDCKPSAGLEVEDVRGAPTSGIRLRPDSGRRCRLAIGCQLQRGRLRRTILHLLGLDHERLTYRYAGRDFRLTDVYGNVIREIIA